VKELEAKLKEEAWYSKSLKEQLAKEKLKPKADAVEGAATPDVVAEMAALQTELDQTKAQLTTAAKDIAQSEARYVALDQELVASATKVSAQAAELLARPRVEEMEALENKLKKQKEISSAAVAAAQAFAEEQQAAAAAAVAAAVAAPPPPTEEEQIQAAIAESLLVGDAAPAAPTSDASAEATDAGQEVPADGTVHAQEAATTDESVAAAAVAAAAAADAAAKAVADAESAAAAAVSEAAAAVDAAVTETAVVERKLEDSLGMIELKNTECDQWKTRYEAAVERATRAASDLSLSTEAAAKMQALERAVAVAEGELGDLQSHSTAADAELVETKTGFAAATATIADLEAGVSELKELIVLNKVEKDKLRDELGEGKKLESEISAELQKYEEAAAVVEAALVAAETKLDERCALFDAKIASQKSAKIRLKERVTAMEQQMIDQGGEMSMMAENANGIRQMEEEAAHEVNKLVDQVELLTSSKAVLENKVTELDGTNTILAASNKKANAENVKVTRSLTLATASVAELEQAKLTIENELGAMAQKTRQSQKDSKALAELVEQSKVHFVKQKVQIQGQLTTTKASLEKAQTELAKLQAERDAAKASSAGDVEKYKTKAESEAAAKRTLERTLTDTRKTLTEEIQQLHTDLGAVQTQCADAENKIRMLTSTVDSITVEKQLGESAFRDVESEKGGLLERVVQGEKQYNDLKTKFNKLEQEHRERGDAVEELGAELTEVMNQLNEVSTRQWEDSKDCKNCANCKEKFTIKRRKHHCRNCGQVFCNACTPHTAKTTTSKKPVRVCTPCLADLAP
jgi:chromosome segregation ATPase